MEKVDNVITNKKFVYLVLFVAFILGGGHIYQLIPALTGIEIEEPKTYWMGKYEECVLQRATVHSGELQYMYPANDQFDPVDTSDNGR